MYSLGYFTRPLLIGQGVVKWNKLTGEILYVSGVKNGNKNDGNDNGVVNGNGNTGDRNGGNNGNNNSGDYNGARNGMNIYTVFAPLSQNSIGYNQYLTKLKH